MFINTKCCLIMFRLHRQKSNLLIFISDSNLVDRMRDVVKNRLEMQPKMVFYLCNNRIQKATYPLQVIQLNFRWQWTNNRCLKSLYCNLLKTWHFFILPVGLTYLDCGKRDNIKRDIINIVLKRSIASRYYVCIS